MEGGLALNMGRWVTISTLHMLLAVRVFLMHQWVPQMMLTRPLAAALVVAAAAVDGGQYQASEAGTSARGMLIWQLMIRYTSRRLTCLTSFRACGCGLCSSGHWQGIELRLLTCLGEKAEWRMGWRCWGLM
jgi:hypothetical protein